MAQSIGASPHHFQIVRVRHDDFLTDTGTGNQVVTILGSTSSPSARIIHIHNAWIATRVAFAGGTVTAILGPETADPDGLVTRFTNTAGQVQVGDGALLRFQSQTVTTAGNNTGTSGAGLSLIPDPTDGLVSDDDNAATTGTAVNVVPENNGVFAYLESTTAGNADGYFAIGEDGPAVIVNDNDSPGGVQLYFDEDAADDEKRFLAVSPTGKDLFIPATNGDCIRVVHDASAASNGVAVYFDDDGANDYDRLLFVSPSDVQGQYDTDSLVTFRSSANLIMNDLLALQEDIASLEAFMDNGLSFAPYALNIGASGFAIKLTLGTDTAWSALTAGEILVGIEYSEPLAANP